MEIMTVIRLITAVFRLDWVLLNVLTTFLDVHGTGVGTRTIELVCEAKEVADMTVDHDIDTFQASSIFIGRCGRPRLNVARE